MRRFGIGDTCFFEEAQLPVLKLSNHLISIMWRNYIRIIDMKGLEYEDIFSELGLLSLEYGRIKLKTDSNTKTNGYTFRKIIQQNMNISLAIEQ